MSGSYALGPAQIEAFERLGYLPHFAHPVLEPGHRVRIAEAIRALEPTTAMPTRPDKYRARLDAGLRWWRGMHLEVPELWAVARHPSILEPARSLLGPNVMWGAAWMMATMPGEIHGWHFDTEYQDEEPGLIVFISLETTPKSPLAVVSGSHRIGVQPSVWVTEGKRGLLDGGDLSNDELVLSAARKVLPEAELVRPDMASGDAMIGAGRLWHGVRNDSDVPRLGLIFFLARPSTRFRIVTIADAVPEYHPRSVACAMLCGEPVGARNEIVPPPVGAR